MSRRVRRCAPIAREPRCRPPSAHALRTRLAAFAAAFALLPSPTAAQQTRVVGLLRTADGRPLAAAVVRWFQRSDLGLPCLEGVGEPAHGTTETDARGMFAVATAGPVLVWVEHDSGVGAFAPRVRAGTPAILAATPLAGVLLPRGARGTFVAAGGVSLGHLAGERLRLPAGRYELLVEDVDGWFVASCELRSGAETVIARTGAAGVRLTLPPAARACVLPFTGAPLGANADAVSLPAAPHPLRVRVERRDRTAAAFDELWAAPDRPLPSLPRDLAWRSLRVVDPAGQPLPNAVAYSVAAAGGQPSVSAQSWGSDDGRVRLRLSEDGFAVVVADGFAVEPRWLRATSEVIELRAGVSANVRLLDAKGKVVAGAPVSFWTESPDLARTEVSDERGEATLRHVPAVAVRVHVDHADYLPFDATLDPTGQGVHEFVLHAGLSLCGVIEADGQPRAGVAVVVRDPTGTLGLSPRRTVTDARGRFAVHGLPDASFVVFARCDLGGKTWSGQASDVQPGQGDCELSIACEDPALPGTVPPARPAR